MENLDLSENFELRKNCTNCNHWKSILQTWKKEQIPQINEIKTYLTMSKSQNVPPYKCLQWIKLSCHPESAAWSLPLPGACRRPEPAAARSLPPPGACRRPEPHKWNKWPKWKQHHSWKLNEIKSYKKNKLNILQQIRGHKGHKELRKMLIKLNLFNHKFHQKPQIQFGRENVNTMNIHPTTITSNQFKIFKLFLSAITH